MMFNPTLVNIATFFYPVGNTAATCLTEDLPHEVEAKLLALGCGDVRNILYTAHCDPRKLQYQGSGIPLTLLIQALLMLTLHAAM